MFAALSAQTYNGTCGDNVNWQLNTRDGVLHITGNGPMYDYTYDTRAPWHPYNSQISMVDIAGTVTRIGNWAFNGYHSIDSINFGGVRTIGNNALNNCQGLSSVYIPQLVTLEDYSMDSNGNLRRFISGNHLKEIQYNALGSCGNLQLVYLGDSIEYIRPYAVSWCGSLDSLYLGECLKQIEYDAFIDCHELKHVVFPATLEQIDWEAFQNGGLLEINIPRATREIASSAFNCCGDVLSITVDPANTTFDSRQNCNAIVHKNDLRIVRGCQNTVIPTSVTTIGDAAFSCCHGLTTITIPNNISTVESYAFESCGLTSVNFPNSIVNCGAAPFSGCTGLSVPIYNNKFFVFLPYEYSGAYTLPQGPTEIVGAACRERQQLTAVYVPAGYSAIGGEAFYYCYALDTASIGEGPTRLPEYCFMGCSSLRGVHLPESLTQIDYYAFQDCRSLLRITIPDAVEVIGHQAFLNCSSLQYVAIPAALQRFDSWGGGTFDGCTSLRHVYWNARTLYDPDVARSAPFYDIRQQMQVFELGDSVRYVPNYLCYEMSSLQSIKIGANVQKIGSPNNLDSLSTVFYNCKSVSSVTWNARNVVNPLMYDYAPFYSFRESVRNFTFGDSVRVIPADLCYGMKNVGKIVIPKNVFYISDYAFRYMDSLRVIQVAAANQYYDSRNNCNAIMEKAGNKLLLGCSSTVVPANTDTIAACAFRNCVLLTSLVVPNSVRYIGKEAFNGCTALQQLTLPNRLTVLEDYVLQDCKSLQQLSLPSALQKIGIRSLSNCKSVQTLSVPASVSSIDKQAFAKMSLNSLTMLGSTPPAADITSLPDACPVYVPCAGLPAYQAAPVWSALGTRLATQYPFAVTASANNALWGNVRIQRSNCDDATLTAEPANGFRFVEWQDINGNRVSTDNPYNITLTGNLTLIAFFQSAGSGSSPAPSVVRVVERSVEVESEEPALWRLYNLNGQPVDHAEGDQVVLTAPVGGMYILKSANETIKVIIK